jgi:hypothetical protein
MKIFLLIAALVCTSQMSFAADCELTIDRSPCPGKETEAMKPYDGKNPTTEKAAGADTEEACLKKAEKSSKIVRKGTLSKKSVTAKLGGKDLGKTFTDEAACK